MKKLLITIAIVLSVTLMLLFVLRFNSNAEELPSGDVTSEDATSEDTINPSVNDVDTSLCTKEATEEFNLYEYIKDKIVPVVVGVLTSASALLATLVAIKRSLTSISEAKESFKKESRARDEEVRKNNEVMQQRFERMEANVEKLQKAVERMEESTKGVPGFEERIAEMSKLCSGMAKILTLGFSANADVVKAGKGKKMELLLNKITVAQEETTNESKS